MRSISSAVLFELNRTFTQPRDPTLSDEYEALMKITVLYRKETGNQFEENTISDLIGWTFRRFRK